MRTGTVSFNKATNLQLEKEREEEVFFCTQEPHLEHPNRDVTTNMNKQNGEWRQKKTKAWRWSRFDDSDIQMPKPEQAMM